jgi:hypothetical protein
VGLAIWIVVIVVCIIGLVFALMTSVTKWSDNMVGKFVNEEDKKDKVSEGDK